MLFYCSVSVYVEKKAIVQKKTEEIQIKKKSKKGKGSKYVWIRFGHNWRHQNQRFPNASPK